MNTISSSGARTAASHPVDTADHTAAGRDSGDAHAASQAAVPEEQRHAADANPKINPETFGQPENKAAREYADKAKSPTGRQAADPYEEALHDSKTQSKKDEDPNYVMAKNGETVSELLNSKSPPPLPDNDPHYRQYPQGIRDLIGAVDRVVYSDRSDMRPRHAGPVTAQEVEQGFRALKELKELQASGARNWSGNPEMSRFDAMGKNKALDEHIRFKAARLFDYAQRHGITLSPEAQAMGRDAQIKAVASKANSR